MLLVMNLCEGQLSVMCLQEDEEETVEGKDVKGNDRAESQTVADEQKKDVDEEREGRGKEGGEGEKGTAEGGEGEERRGQEGEGEERTAKGGEGEMSSKEGEGSERRKRAGNENEEEEVVPETVSSVEPTETKPSEDISGGEKDKSKSEEKVEGETSTVESSEDQQRDRERDRESDRESDRAPKAETTSRAEGDGGGGGGGGGWGWGGWGKSLWSSVSTVTGSAQVLGQKVTHHTSLLLLEI